MSTLLVLRGLPASGKSTFAREWAEERPARTRVNRDDLRYMLYGRHDGLTHSQEDIVTSVENRTVQAALKHGRDVVVDAMHLRPKYVRKWETLAREYGAEFEVKEFEISIEQSCHRNHLRWICNERSVPKAAIEKMRKYLAKDGRLMPYEPLPEEPRVEVEPYVPDTSKPRAIIVDLDGTLALHNGRSPYDLSRVHEDSVCIAVDTVADALCSYGGPSFEVIFLSGREQSAEAATRKWLKDEAHWGLGTYELYMRATGDGRKGAIVKRELFDAHVRNRFNVLAVFDDRPSVCRMWRELGLFTFQVGDPHVEF